MANDDSTVNTGTRLPLAVGLVASAAAACSSLCSRSESVRRVLVDISSREGLEQAGWMDRVAAAGYGVAGWWGADAARALAVGLPVLAVFLVAVWAVGKLPSTLRRRGRVCVYAFALLVFVAGGVRGVQAWRSDTRDLRLLLPVELLASAAQGGGRVFFNTPGLLAAALLRPGTRDDMLTPQLVADLSQSPVRWRAEDRERPFSWVLLAVPLENSRALIAMLGRLPDWRLARVDNQGLLFQRGGEGVVDPSPREAARLFKGAKERSLYLAQSALVLNAINRNRESQTLMDEAVELSPSDSSTLVSAAMLAAMRNRWRPARDLAAQALQNDGASIQARYLHALALLETGNIPLAAEESERLVRSRSGDASILQLHARISREANDPNSEVAALQKLLALATKNRQPVAAIQIHLAQAWARSGFAAKALENYRAALTGDLTPEQKTEIAERIQLIQSRSRLP